MIDFKNKVYTGAQNRRSLFDCVIPENAKGVIVFMHGYKGYKDWGAWNLMQDFFVEQGYGFVKFNVSHNGGTVEQPKDFQDLEAFGENCYSFELYDLGVMVLEVDRMLRHELLLNVPIHLIGHSRGGGMVILQGATDDRVASIISLAGISSIEDRFPVGDELNEWKEQGVRYVVNGRTNQQMPHYYSFYQDFVDNKESLSIEQSCLQLEKPFLQIHGDMDMSVSISEGLKIAEWTDTEMVIIKGAEHTFGTMHPWESDDLPEEMKEVMDQILSFLRRQTS